MTLLDDTIAGGQSGHITDHQHIATKLNALGRSLRADYSGSWVPVADTTFRVEV